MEIFVSATNDFTVYFTLLYFTVAINNFVLDATGVLDSLDRL